MQYEISMLSWLAILSNILADQVVKSNVITKSLSDFKWDSVIELSFNFTENTVYDAKVLQMIKNETKEKYVLESSIVLL